MLSANGCTTGPQGRVWKTDTGKILDLPAEQRTYYFQLTENNPHKISDYSYE